MREAVRIAFTKTQTRRRKKLLLERIARSQAIQSDLLNVIEERDRLNDEFQNRMTDVLDRLNALMVVVECGLNAQEELFRIGLIEGQQ